ncbi:hypothetical protein FY046_00310 [Erwinia sp. 1181_3]|uniref:hypothetical protein n=1 Tax=Erwinia sp. 1181_3 TaxID=2605957 RepID=UPI0040589F32
MDNRHHPGDPGLRQAHRPLRGFPQSVGFPAGPGVTSCRLSWKSALPRRGLIAAQKVNGRVKIKRKTNQIDQTQKAFLVLFNLLDFGFDVEAAIKLR